MNLRKQSEILVPWLHAMRLRTLPLALSSTFLGSFLAIAERAFKWQVFVLAALTTLLLQILSNLANDYGDYTKGTDSSERIGPPRMVSTGAISPKEMKIAISVVVCLTLLSGLMLIYQGLGVTMGWEQLIFLLAGISAITAAIKYTVGKNPYGYQGWGDVFVFIFFGLVGVGGTYYLHTGTFKTAILLPSASIGLLSVGVLNLNNMRDYFSDKKAGKKTLVVILGTRKAKVYHVILITGAFLLTFIFSLYHFKSVYQLLFIISAPLFYQDIKRVIYSTRATDLNPELRRLAISTFLFTLSTGIGILISTP
jgi:1,4-dihydroxy-2-naphthoate polyprenyltransferase